VTFLRNTSAGTNAHPLDDAVSSDSGNLYVFNANLDQLAEFSVGRDAHLTAVGTQALPAGSAGVAELISKRPVRGNPLHPAVGREPAGCGDPHPGRQHLARWVIRGSCPHY
jgi:hypothetical protein